MNYITQTDYEHYKGVTLTGNGVNMFDLMLPTMQDMVDTYCNRTWNFTNPVTEYFDAMRRDGDGLVVNDIFYVKYPRVSENPYNISYPLAGGIHSISIGGTDLDMNYVFNYGTHIVTTAMFPTSFITNPVGLKAVKIIYESDAASNPPTPIKQALIEWIARKIDTAPDSNKEAFDVRAGSVMTRFTPDKFGGIPDFVKLVLDQYRLAPIDRF